MAATYAARGSRRISARSTRSTAEPRATIDIDLNVFVTADHFAEVAAPMRDLGVLAPEHLVVCKVVFNRAKDWVDLDAMRALGRGLDTAEVLRWVARIAGDDDPRYERIAALLTT